ncbi:MAG: VWA domain-containing protein, partial [Clostridia bacterium]|nr:VWA domain-containing protein [Clostridia bacterium]
MKNRKTGKILLVLLMSVAMMFTMGFSVSVFATGENAQGQGGNQDPDLGAPEVHKTLTPNNVTETAPDGDGTYTLSLSVRGAKTSESVSSKADVIVVFDASNSMSQNSIKEYAASNTGRYYQKSNGDYEALYRYNANSGRYTQLNSDDYTGDVYYKNGSNYTKYEGQRYVSSTKTRLAIAKECVNELASELLANNDDRIRMSLVRFSLEGEVISFAGKQYTSDINQYKTAVNNISSTYGTNWESALKKAGEVTTREDAEKYVIFVSDGNPTLRDSQGPWGESMRSDGKYGNLSESDTNVSHCYDTAVDYAKALTNDDNEHFYGIGIFGNIDRMKLLVKDAYGTDRPESESNYYSSKDREALEEAFADIVNQISNAASYTDVEINDQITSMTSALIKAEADEGSFRYTRSGGAYGTGEEWTGNNVPQANYDKNTGAVTWDLGDMELEAQVTYTVSFKVWPSQEAYDLVADLMNGKIEYSDLSEAQSAQIVKLKNGGYGLKTNIEATTDYTQILTRTTDVKPEGFVEGGEADDGYTYHENSDGTYTGTKLTDPATVTMPDPDPMPLTGTTMTVKKNWVPESAAASETGSVYFDLMKKSEKAGEADSVVLENIKLKGPNWEETVHIAPGLKVNGEVLEAGHDYYLKEKSTGYRYEFNSTECHPMLVDSATQVTNPDGSACALTGTNTQRSDLEVKKLVVGKTAEDSSNDLFRYKVKVTNSKASTSASENKVWFSIRDADGFVKDTGRVTGATPESGDTGYYYADSGSEITISIKNGENFFFTNLPVGSTYSVTEDLGTNLPAGYSLQKVVDKGKTGDAAISTDATVSGTIEKNGTLYSYEYYNEYKAAPAKAKLQVKKQVTGHDAVEAFNFKMEAASNNPEGAVMPSSNTVTIAKDGLVAGGEAKAADFNEITFEKEGTYKFNITETAGTSDGWTYDNSTKQATVVVTDNKAGKLVATVSYKNDDNTFVNSYTAAPTTAKLQVKKQVTGHDAVEPFAFVMRANEKNPEGAVMPSSNTVTIAKDGLVAGGDPVAADFNEIAFNKAGTYKFDIDETTTTSLGGWTYDSSVKEATVEVVDNGEGQLVATVSYKNNDNTFVNNYSVTGTSVKLEVEKVLENLDLIEGQFGFQLYEGYDAEGTELFDPAVNDAKGNVVFPALDYSTAGEYTYSIKEVVPNGVTADNDTKDGIKYDLHVVNVTVHVVDVDGQLRATTS